MKNISENIEIGAVVAFAIAIGLILSIGMFNAGIITAGVDGVTVPTAPIDPSKAPWYVEFAKAGGWALMALVSLGLFTASQAVAKIQEKFN